MMLLNLIGYLIGFSFIEGYNNYYWGHSYFFESLFLISIYSVFQIFIFPITKKYREFIIPIITLSLFSLILFSSDTSGYGFEIIDGIVSVSSKSIVLFTFIADSIVSDKIRINFIKLLYSLGFSIYLQIVFSSFKYILTYLTKFCQKNDYDMLLSNKT
jgi:hypothetical protein